MQQKLNMIPQPGYMNWSLSASLQASRLPDTTKALIWSFEPKTNRQLYVPCLSWHGPQ